MSHDISATATAERALVSGRSWVSWGAVFSGALIGVAVMTLLDLFWYAIGAAGPNFVSDNIAWFLGGTAIVATFLAGLFAGWFVSGRGPAIGVVHGLTEWGLLTFAVVAVGPGVAALIRSMVGSGVLADGSSWLWASFWSVLIALAAAVVGGVIGGNIRSPRADTTAIGSRATDSATDARPIRDTEPGAYRASGSEADRRP